MENYLGETIVDTKKHPKFKIYTPKDWAMKFIELYGSIDGEHHKTWVLDQVSRILKGTKVIVKEAAWENGHKEYRFSLGKPSKKYLKWVEEMKGEVDENGDYEYSYDEGIAP